MQFYKGIGIYVIMLLEVTYSLLKVIIFAILIIMFVAFGLFLTLIVFSVSKIVFIANCNYIYIIIIEFLFGIICNMFSYIASYL